MLKKEMDMKFLYQDYMNMVQQVRKYTDFIPTIGAVLGSGLGKFVNKVDVVAEVPYSEIQGLPVSTNKAHHGQFIFGYYKSIPMVLMDGRIHYYEGYTAEEVVRPQRLMALLGAKKIILTNAAGGIDANFTPGDLMIIDDHIASFMPSPLIGSNIDEFGTRFPDMSDVYNKHYSDLIYQKAKESGIALKRGTYVQFAGPQFETKAEVQMAKILGGSCAGMSTAIEAIALNHMGVKVVGISFISNLACGISNNKITDEEVLEQAKTSEEKILKVFEIAIETLNNND